MRTLSSVCTLLILISACAEPRPPLGGPADKTPPSLVAAEPVNESVEVHPEFIRLTFSDYLEENSFTQAFSITPTPSGPPRFRWRGRSVTIRFEDEWRDSTTYVVTLDTRLRSWRGVSLLQPILTAFATGPVIDQGRLRGRAVDALRGNPVEGLSVFAFEDQHTASAEPAYVSSTGGDGRFDLSYVREGEYYVILLQDANRNRRPDPGERFAVPPHPAIHAAVDTTAPRAVWVVGRLDTLSPAIDRVRAISSTRLSVRFSEAIMMPQQSTDRWKLSDSASGIARTVRQVYARMYDPYMLFLETDSLDDRTWSLSPDTMLSDSSGNSIVSEKIYFSGRARADTMQLRFLGEVPEVYTAEIGLSPRDYAGLEFSRPVPDSIMSQIVQVADSLGETVPFSAATANGTLYTLDIDFSTGDYAKVSVSLADVRFAQVYRRLAEGDLGSLSGVVMPGGADVIVELLPEVASRPYALTRADDKGAFLFDGLPAKTYLIRSFLDRNGNSRWDPGAVMPFMAAEPIAWLSEPLTVRPRWDTSAGDTLRLTPVDSLLIIR